MCDRVRASTRPRGDTEEDVDIDARLAVREQDEGAATEKLVRTRHAVDMEAKEARRETTTLRKVEMAPQPLRFGDGHVRYARGSRSLHTPKGRVVPISFHGGAAVTGRRFARHRVTVLRRVSKSRAVESALDVLFA